MVLTRSVLILFLLTGCCGSAVAQQRGCLDALILTIWDIGFSPIPDIPIPPEPGGMELPDLGIFNQQQAPQRRPAPEASPLPPPAPLPAPAQPEPARPDGRSLFDQAL